MSTAASTIGANDVGPAIVPWKNKLHFERTGH
uniref:Uncharacterized protein n=1 Tax=Arundo donax TaxID=35708 RepID=A0A0A9FG63_ARUDO